MNSAGVTQVTPALRIGVAYLGFGALHDWSENLRIGFALNWADLGRASVDTANVKGRYKKNDVFLFNVSFQLKDLPWAGKLML